MRWRPSSPGRCGWSETPRRQACNTDVVSSFKVIVEKHDDGYVAYPVGMKGVIVGEGDSYDAALADVTSAIRFHVETFGADALGGESPVLEAFVVDTEVPV